MNYTDLAGYVVNAEWPQSLVRVPPKVAAQIDRGQCWVMRASLAALADMMPGPQAVGVDKRRAGLVVGYLPPLEREFQTQARVYYAEFAQRLSKQLERHGFSAAAAEKILAQTEAAYKQDLPTITEDTLLGYMGSITAARVAQHLDWQGPSLMIESACASSLAALDLAMQHLRSGACDLMLAGGMYASLGVDALSQCCSFGGLSTQGSFPFDARADGYVTAEGAALVALKRLSDAEP